MGTLFNRRDPVTRRNLVNRRRLIGIFATVLVIAATLTFRFPDPVGAVQTQSSVSWSPAAGTGPSDNGPLVGTNNAGMRTTYTLSAGSPTNWASGSSAYRPQSIWYASATAFTPPAVRNISTTPALRIFGNGCTAPGGYGEANGSYCSRGQVTISFSQPVRNPVVHFDGNGTALSGGASNFWLGQRVIWDLATPGGQARAVSGGMKVNNYTRITSQRTPTAGVPYDENDLASGTVEIGGVYTSLTFNLGLWNVMSQGAESEIQTQLNNGFGPTVGIGTTFEEDFGDAPTSFQGTSDVASHIPSNLSIGGDLTVDVDNAFNDGSANTDSPVASSDYLGDTDDGFTGPQRATAGDPYVVTVPLAGATKAGKACGWLDINGSGTWSSTEGVCANFAAGATSATITLPTPPTAGVTLGMRLRASYDTDMNTGTPAGRMDSGEVEDWPVTIVVPTGYCSNPPNSNLVQNGGFDAPGYEDGYAVSSGFANYLGTQWTDAQNMAGIPALRQWHRGGVNGGSAGADVAFEAVTAAWSSPYGGGTAHSGDAWYDQIGTVTAGGTNNQYIYQDVPVIAGRTYRLTYRHATAKGLTATGYVGVGDNNGQAAGVDGFPGPGAVYPSDTISGTATTWSGWRTISSYWTPTTDLARIVLVPGTTKNASGVDQIYGNWFDSVTLIEEPTVPQCALELTKYVIDRNGVKQDAQTATGPMLVVGDTATFRYEVVRTQSSVYSPWGPPTIADDGGTPDDTSDDFTAAYLSGDTNADDLVDNGETWVYQATRPIVADQYTNIGTLTYDYLGTPTTKTDVANYLGLIDPTVRLVKLVSVDGGATWEDANEAPLPTVMEGQPVRFRYSVTQQDGSNTELSNVVLIDDNGTSTNTTDDTTLTLSGGDDDNDGRIDPTENWLYTLDRTAILGTYVNTVSGLAESPISIENFSDIAGYTGTPKPVDVQVTKTASTATVNTGGTLDYTITVRNTGLGDAADVTLTDSPAPGVTLGAVSGDCTALPCTFATLAAGESKTVTVAATLSSVVDTNLANTASVSTATTETDTTNNASTVSVAVVVDADLRLAKTVNPLTITAGSSSTFRLRVTNLGPTPSGDFSVSDTFPAGLTIGTLPPGCTSVGSTVTCTGTGLAVDAGVNFDVPVTAPLDGTYANTATVSSTEDPNPANNTESATLTVTPLTNVTITKGDAAPVIAGQTATFPITTTNLGPSAAQAVTVTDEPPAGFVFDPASSSAGCSFAGGIVTCTIGTLEPGASTMTMIGYTVPPTTAPGTYTGIASAATTTPETNGTDNSDIGSVVVTQAADLEIVKSSADGGTVAAGATQTWNIVVTNKGPSTATGVSVADTVPSPLVAASIVITTTKGTCTRANSNVACSIGTMAPGTTVTITIAATVPSGVSEASTTNSATVTSTSADPVSLNNSSSDTVSVERRNTVAFAKTVSNPTPAAGSRITYTIEAVNGGPSTSTNSVVTDALPAGVTPVSATSNLGTCTVSGQNVTCAPVTILDGQTLTVTVTADVSPSVATNTLLTNSARFTNNEGAAHTATADILTTRDAALDVTKTGPATVVAGAPATWTITARNDGPSDASDVVITDLGGANLTITNITASPAAGTTCSVATQSCTIATLPAGATVTITVITDVSPTATGNVSNAAVYSSPDDPSEDPVSPPVIPVDRAIDLSVTKTASTSQVKPGDAFVYTLVVTNAGPSTLSPSDAATVTDTLPAGVTAGILAPGCTKAGQTVTCTLGELAAGESSTFSIPVTIGSGYSGTSVVNTATLTGPADPDGGNNSSTVTTPVTAVSDLSVTKTTVTAPADIVAGQNIVYDLRVTNGGPMTASSVTLTDPIPTGLAFVSVDDPACTNGATLTCTWSNLASGASKTVRLTLSIGSAYTGAAKTAGLTNTATVTGPTVDGDPGNNSATVTDTVTARPTLRATKTASGPLVAGSTATYTITVSNDGPSTASQVTATDVVPSPLTVVSVGPGCTAAAGTVTCDAGTLVPGATASFTVVVSIPPGTPDGTAVTNVATISTPTDPGSSVPAIDVNSVTARADLSITKTGPATFTPGGKVTYTITATNNGPSDALDVRVEDSLPATIDTFTNPTNGTCTKSGAELLCTIGTLAPGATSTITVTMQTPSSAGDVTNTARVVTTTTDPVPANNQAQATSTADVDTDLSVTKSVQGTLVAGAIGTYLIKVANTGPSDARDVVVTDTLPAGVTLSDVSVPGGTCAPTISCTITRVPAGQTVTVTVNVLVDQDVPAGTNITNTAATADPNDTDPTDNGGSTSDSVTTSADLQLAKVLTTSPVVAGADVSWTLTLTNNGPSAAAAATITDTLDPVFSNVRAVDPACTVTGNKVVCTWPSLAAGDTRVVTITAKAAADATGTVTNTAAASSDTPDPVPDNDDPVTPPVPVTAESDLRMAKTNPTNLVAGATATYLLAVTNQGPSATPSATTVTDTLPAGLTFVSGPGCTAAGQVVTCAVPVLATGATHTIGLVVEVADPAPASITNTASVAPAGGSTDPDPSNNSSSTTPLDPTTAADVAVTKTLDTSPVVSGRPVTFTITTTNNGPSRAINTITTDTLDTVFSGITTDDPTSCTVAGQTVTCNYGILADGETRTVKVTATLSAAATGSITNTASGSSDTPDPVPDNDDPVIPPTPVDSSADVEFAKTLTGELVAGRTTEWTITATNRGPSSATGVTITDTVPAPLTNVASPTPGCTVVGNTVTCPLGTLPANTTRSVVVTAVVPTGASGSVTNTATGSSDTPDPDPSDNTPSAGPSTIERISDLSVVKQAPTTIVPGTNATWTIRVTNAGPSVSGGTTVTDALPAGLTFVSGDGCTAAGQNVTCTVPSLASGATHTITLVTAVASSLTSSVANTATLQTPAGWTDPVPGNNSYTTDPNNANPTADLAVTKTLLTNPVVAGQDVEWEVKVTNNGPSTAQGVQMTDTLPAGLTFREATPSVGTCSNVAGVVTCDLGSLPPGATATVRLRTFLDSGTTGKLSNSAEASSNTPDPVPANDEGGTPPSDITTSADVEVTKTLDTTPIVAGTNAAFTITVINNGPSNARAVRITDQLPSTLTFQTAVPGRGVCTQTAGLVTCDLGDLEPGAVVKIAVTALVSPSATGDLVNTASSSSVTPDPAPDNDDPSTDPVPIDASADVEVTKTLETDPVVAGKPATFSIVVTNRGPSTARNVKVADTLAASLLAPTASTSIGACTVLGATVDCSLGDLAPGAVATVTVTATVAPTATGTLSNSATSSSDTPDPVPDNDDPVTPPEPVTAESDLSLVKTNPVALVAGTEATYRLVVTNSGPSAMTAPGTVTDTLPAGLTFVSGPGCSAPTQPVTCTVPVLTTGATHTIDLVVRVADPAPASVTNSATVTPPPGSNDPDPSDNTSKTDPLVPTSSADIEVTKTLDTVPVMAGLPVTFTITTTNNGPSRAVDTVTTDTLDAVFSNVTTDDPTSCAVTGRTVRCAYGTLANGETRTVKVTATLSATATGSITNTASGSSGTPDPVPDNDDPVIPPTPVGSDSDVEFAKTLTGELVAGRPTQWTITATNRGPSVATGVKVTDTVPAPLTNVATATPGCTVTGNAVSCELGTLAPNATATVVVTADVPTGASGSVTNTATGSSDTSDPDPSDNTPSAGPSTIERVADLSLVKQAPATIVPGTNATWTIRVTNAGPSVSGGTTVTDALPAGLTFVSGDGCTAAGQNVTCTVPSLTSGTTHTITLVTAVALSVTDPVSNTATVQTPAGWTDSVPGNNSYTTDPNNPNPSADVAVTKRLVTSPVVAGQDVEWEVKVTNNGPSTAQGVRMTDTLPASLTFRRATPSAGTCAHNAGTVTCDIGALAPGASATVALVTALAGDATGKLSNSATASSNTPDAVPGNDETSTVPTDITTSADLEVTKTLDTTPVVAGTRASFTIRVVNNGPSVARNVHVADPLPSSLSFVSAVAPSGPCTSNGTRIDCSLGDLAVGEVALIKLTALVDPTATGDLVNSASASSDTPDSKPDNSGDSTPPESISTSADVSLTKTLDTDPVVAGKRVTFTLLAHNNGPSAARDVTVTDDLPDTLLNPSVTTTAGACNVAGRTVACNLGLLAAGATVTIKVTATVDQDAVGKLTNSATTDSQTPDPVPDNDDPVTPPEDITTSADVVYGKTIDDTPVPGNDTVFTLTATNTGPSTAAAVKMVDTLDAVFSNIRAESADGTCEVAGQTVTCSFGDLTTGSDAAATITALLDPAATGEVVNTASGSSETPDPDPDDDTPSIDPTPVEPTGDLSLAKQAPETFVLGTDATWKLLVTNDGPSLTPATVVDDLLPTGLTFVSGTGCTAVGQAVTCTVPALRPGATHSIDLVTKVEPTAGTKIVNTAQVVVPSGVVDPVPGNNSSTTDPTDPKPNADLAVTIDPVGGVDAGKQAVWEVVVTNNGPSSAQGSKVTIELDPWLTFESADFPGCRALGRTVTCDLDLLPSATGENPADGVRKLRLTTSVSPAATGNLKATATVASTTTDTVAGNNVDTAEVGVTARADLETTKTAPASVEAGRNATWTITVTNKGPATAADVVVVDELDGRLAFVSATGATCTAEGAKVSCPIGDLAVGESRKIELTTLVASSATGTISNSAVAETPTDDPVDDNDKPVTPPQPVVVSGPVELVKTTTTPTVMVEDTATFNLRLRGMGPADAEGVRVIDPLPVGMTFLSEGSDPRCSAAGATVLCPVGRVAAGATENLTVRVRITASGGMTNIATADATTTDAKVESAVEVAAKGTPVPPPVPPAPTIPDDGPAPSPLPFTGGRMSTLLVGAALVMVAVGVPLALPSRRRRG